MHFTLKNQSSEIHYEICVKPHVCWIIVEGIIAFTYRTVEFDGESFAECKDLSGSIRFGAHQHNGKWFAYDPAGDFESDGMEHPFDAMAQILYHTFLDEGK